MNMFDFVGPTIFVASFHSEKSGLQECRGDHS